MSGFRQWQWFSSLPNRSLAYSVRKSVTARTLIVLFLTRPGYYQEMGDNEIATELEGANLDYYKRVKSGEVGRKIAGSIRSRAELNQYTDGRIEGIDVEVVWMLA